MAIQGSALGRLAADAELKHTKGGDTLLSFRIATDHGFGDKKTTTWVGCTLWGKRAERLAEHLTKGSRIMVTGEFYNEEYEGKLYLKCDVSSVEFAGEKKSSEGGDGGGGYDTGGRRGGKKGQPVDDDLPFVCESTPDDMFAPGFLSVLRF